MLYRTESAEQQSALWYYGLDKFGKFLTSPVNVNLINMKLVDLIKDQYDLEIPFQDTKDIREDIIRLYLDNKAEIELEWKKLEVNEQENEIIKFNMKVVNRLLFYLDLYFKKKENLLKKWDSKKRVPRTKKATGGDVVFFEDMHPEVMGRRHRTDLS